MRRLAAAVDRRLQQQRARVRHAGAVLQACSPQRRLLALHQRLALLRARPEAALRRRLQRDALQLRGLARSLEAVSPLATIARGYSILQREDGTVVRRVDDVTPGDTLQARLSDGHLKVRVASSEA